MISNALTHGHAGAVVARAVVRGDHVELRIVDHGPGLSPARTESMFAPFQRRGDRDTTSGVGLGLAVARGFTEAMGGTLRAEHTPGRRPHHGDQPAGRPDAARRRVHRRGGPRAMTHVLVVDDDPHILRTLRIHLAAHGYTVATADTGHDAIAAAATEHPDLVVLDLGLPDIDGTAVITALRAKSTTPIIVLSARIDAPDKVQALDTGADDYVTKPFGIAELLARMRAAARRADLGTGPGDGRHPATDEILVHTPAFTIDLAAKKVTRNGAELRLTPTEWAILDILVRHRGALVHPVPTTLPRYGAPTTAPKPTTSASTSPNCGRNSNPNQHAPLSHHRTRHGLPLRTPERRHPPHEKAVNCTHTSPASTTEARIAVSSLASAVSAAWLPA